MHGVSNLWSTAHIQTKAKYFMLMLGLNKTIDQLAIEKSVHLYGNVLRMAKF